MGYNKFIIKNSDTPLLNLTGEIVAKITSDCVRLVASQLYLTEVDKACGIYEHLYSSIRVRRNNI